jgi:hypothetical protein
LWAVPQVGAITQRIGWWHDVAERCVTEPFSS